MVALIYADGTVCATYSYNAWGEILSVTTTSTSVVSNLAAINPLRYRGYCYDTETGWYYLQSRYYDPIVKRFINADTYSSTGQGFLGYNMFAYCNNNPVLYADSTGEFGWFTLAAAAIGAVIGAATQIVTNIATGEEWYSGVVGAAVGGAVYNAVAITTGSLVAASAASTAAESVTNEVISYVSGEKEFNAENVAKSLVHVATDVAVNTVVTAATGKLAEKVVKINKGWFKPKKLISSFTGKYAQRVWKQTGVQGGALCIVKSIQGWARAADAK